MSILGSLLGGGSNRPEPSETMQSNAGGLMSKFNPFNLVSGMFGGRKAGAADSYAKTPNGMRKGLKESKKKDPKFVSKTPRSDMPVQKGESVTDIAAKLYGLIKRNDEKKKKELQIEENFAKSFNDVKEKRNQQLIAALTTQPVGLKKETKSLKKDSDKTKKEIPKQPGAQPPAAAAPKGPARAAAKPPSATPAPAAPPAAPATAVPAAPSVSTATKVAVGVGALVSSQAALASVSQAIGKTEAGHTKGVPEERRYDVAFGDSVRKDGSIMNTIPRGKTKTGEPVPTAEEFSESKLGKKKRLSEFTLSEVRMFQAERDRILKGSGAVGTYQFMPTVLFGKDRKSGGLVKSAGMNPDTTIFNRDTQDKLQELLVGGNVGMLKKAGVPLTAGNLYMAHYIGAPGAIQVHKAVQKKEDITVAGVMRRAGMPIGVNPELEKMKVLDFEKTLETRLVQKGGLNLAETQKELSQPQSEVKSQAKKLAEASTENKDLKKQAAAAGGPVVVNQTNNIVASADNSKTMTVPRSDASTFARGAAT